VTRVIPRWLPNALTLLRIAMVPAWLALGLFERQRALAGADVHRLAFIALLLFIGATDVTDGLLARRFHLESNLGATLDAVADKLAGFVAATFLTFFAQPAFTPLPAWLWFGLLGRDLLLGIGWLTVFAKHRAVHVEHRWHGRVASLLLFVLVLASCAAAPREVIEGIALAVAALAVPGTAVYMREGFRQLAPPRPGA
jgi:cardiolipin synthase